MSNLTLSAQSRSRRRLSRAVIVLLLAAASLFGLPTAAQAAGECDTPTYLYVTLNPNSGVVRYGPLAAGNMVCEYPGEVVRWPDNHFQLFIVGFNPRNSSVYPVYDTYQRAPYSNNFSPWRNLGGNARSPVRVFHVNWTQIGIEVVGTTGCWYWKAWDNGWWPDVTGWYKKEGSCVTAERTQTAKGFVGPNADGFLVMPGPSQEEWKTGAR